MSKIRDIAPHIQWVFEQVQAKFPQGTFKMRWCYIMEAFVIATNDSKLLHSEEYSEFIWQMENELLQKSPFLLYFTFDSTLRLNDYDIDDINIDLEKYTMPATKKLDELREKEVPLK